MGNKPKVNNEEQLAKQFRENLKDDINPIIDTIVGLANQRGSFETMGHGYVKYLAEKAVKYQPLYGEPVISVSSLEQQLDELVLEFAEAMSVS